MQKETLTAAVYQQREATLRRVAVLSDEQWDLQCPVPAPGRGFVRLDQPVRRIRDLVAHLIVVDEIAMRGSALRSWVGMRRLDSPEAWDRRRLDPLLALSVSELVTLLARRGERFAALAAAAPSAVAHMPVRGPFGRQPLLHVVARRVLHEWLHEADIAAGQGLSAPPSPTRDVALVVAEAVLQVLPAATLPHVGRSIGVVRLVIELAPGSDTPGARTLTWGMDFSRRLYGPRVVTAPDATVTTAATDLALVANGRASWDDPGVAPRVTGDADLAAALLRALAVPRAQAPANHGEVLYSD